jgi:hypothetical protein
MGKAYPGRMLCLSSFPRVRGQRCSLTFTHVSNQFALPNFAPLNPTENRCTEGIVEKSCGKEAVEFMNIMLRMALSRLPDIVCQGYGPENPECRQLLPPPGTNPKGAKSSSVLSRLFSAYTGL